MVDGHVSQAGFLLGRVQFGVHIGLVPALSCRFLICLFVTDNLQRHLHLSL